MQDAVASLDADLVCLQEVRRINHKEAARFVHWPDLPQADFLAPSGYEAVYRTNAFTKHGEHGNALLSCYPVIALAHEDMSDHRFEQRGLLHATVRTHERAVHVIVVHLGLIASSRQRQMAQLSDYIARNIPAQAPVIVAGDFNSPIAPVRWAQAAFEDHAHLQPSQPRILHALRGHATFPSAMPMVQLDHVFVRLGRVVSSEVPRGGPWARMSDHLPLVAEVEL